MLLGLTRLIIKIRSLLVQCDYYHNTDKCHRSIHAATQSVATFAALVVFTLVSENSAYATSSASPQPNAVILLYHHVSTTTPASTSVSPETFLAHMEYIKANHNVVSLDDVVNALKTNTALPDKAVAITFDDGYANILENAHPILAKMGFPYTIFINPDEIGVGSHQLTWQQVEAMHKDGVTFANHTLDHLHMLDGETSLGQDEWLQQVWNNVETAEARIADKLNDGKKFLAYPFGEFNVALTKQLASAGYIGFGQHSGAVGPYSNLQALPRFPAAGIYANLSPLKTKLNSLSMPVTHTTMPEPRLFKQQLDSAIGLTINTDDLRLSQVACFFGGEKIETNITGNTVYFTIGHTLPIGRSRVNCTAPSINQRGRYYWYSTPFFIPNEKGTYPD